MITVESFAKVNRSLVVLGKRPDGFHEIDTVFQTIDLTDRLDLEDFDDLVLTTNDPGLSVGEDNLVMRAARALQKELRLKRGARMRLSKSIPVGSGLGGGSSNAAAALAGLTRLWGLDVHPDRLRALAAAIGSDVPFFLVGGSARGRGRGEVVEPLPDLARLALLLVIPPFGLSTADVYGALRAPLLSGSLTGIGRDTNLRGSEPGGFPDRNDLEPAAESLRGELRSLRQALVRAGAFSARLSGSGSTVFGLFRDVSTAKRAAGGLGELPFVTRVEIVPTITRTEFAKRASPRITN